MQFISQSSRVGERFNISNNPLFHSDCVYFHATCSDSSERFLLSNSQLAVISQKAGNVRPPRFLPNTSLYLNLFSPFQSHSKMPYMGPEDLIFSWALIQEGIGGATGKESACWCRRPKRLGFDTWVGKIPWRRAWQSTPVFLPGESHGQRSLVGYGL